MAGALCSAKTKEFVASCSKPANCSIEGEARLSTLTIEYSGLFKEWTIGHDCLLATATATATATVTTADITTAQSSTIPYYGTVLYYSVLYYSVLYCAVLFCSVKIAYQCMSHPRGASSLGYTQ